MIRVGSVIALPKVGPDVVASILGYRNNGPFFGTAAAACGRSKGARPPRLQDASALAPLNLASYFPL